MIKKNVVIAVLNNEYIAALEYNLISAQDENITLTIITDEEYYKHFFSHPQKIDCLIIDESLISDLIEKQRIDILFVLTEREDNLENTGNYNMIYKYSSVKEVYHKIVGKLRLSDNKDKGHGKRETRIISVHSPIGGVGKTTAALALCYQLSRLNKKVIYINLDDLQSYLYYFGNPDYKQVGWDRHLRNRSSNMIQYLNDAILHNDFDCLLPLKGSRIAYGIQDEDYLYMIDVVKNSNLYEYIIIDLPSVFNFLSTNVIAESDNVVFVTDQSRFSAFRMEQYIDALINYDQDKMIYVCNKFEDKEYNYLQKVPFEYIEKYDYEIDYNRIKNTDIMKKTALLLV